MLKNKIGLGCWSLGDDAYGNIGEAETKKIIQTAQKNGITFFDTSPTYGKGLSENRLGAYLENKNELFITTKVGMLNHDGFEIPQDFSHGFIRKSLEGSLQRLGLSNLSLLQLHSPNRNYQKDFPDIFEVLDDLKSDGLISKVGISLKYPEDIEIFSKDYDWDSYQFNFSLIDQRIFSKIDCINKLKDKILIARTPLNFGFLTENFNDSLLVDSKSHLSKWDKSQIERWGRGSNTMSLLAKHLGRGLRELALRFIVDQEWLTFAIPGVANSFELIENLDSLKGKKLTKLEMIEIRETYFKIENEMKVESPFYYVRNKELQ
jgi:aryl-alcohol dehydrogenase-like predicted oxidoreductase